MAVNPFRMFKEIIRVVSITPGGRHVWVETIHGTFRKPIGSVPHYLLDEFKGVVVRSTQVDAS